MAKVGAGQLSDILSQFSTPYDPNLIVGYDKADDASVYKVSEDTAVVNTVDFFPPVCDDPYMYGQIAAANALSDVYAMGGRPTVALNIMAVTEDMDSHTVSEVLRGGYDKAAEAGCIITGGHTITSAEPLYGLAVTGLIDPHHIWSNDGARVWDKLILTKPLGTGIMMTAYKADCGLLTEDEMAPVLANMAALNKVPAQVVSRFDVSCVTDITGFGFAGHSLEIARGSEVTLRFSAAKVPYYPQAFDFAEMGIIPAGAYRNRDHVGSDINCEKGVPLALEDILFDPQTSGGLLCAVSPEDAEPMLKALAEAGVQAWEVGEVWPQGPVPVEVRA